MHTTSVSLLQQLRRPRHNEAWKRFVALYTPLLFHWGRKLGVPEADVPDLVQDVLLTLLKELPRFEYRLGQRFRGWLWTVTANKSRERRRWLAVRPLEFGSADTVPDDGASEALAEAEYRQYLIDRALQLMQAEFEATTWRACWEFVVCGRPALDVAKELGITANAVYLAKARVLRRLRQELDGLLEW